MAEPSGAGKSKRQGVWLAAAGLVLLIAMGALVWWAIARSTGSQPVAQGPGFEQYRPAWESAMAKAGVEATYPDEPVALEQLRPTGRQPFSATFTADEIAALINVYPFESALAGTNVVLTDVDVSFPRIDVAGAKAKLVADGTRYEVEATLPLEYTAKGISSTGPAQLRAEGFGVSGARKQQAITALVGYLNSYLRAAPGLTVDSAKIVKGELVVAGSSPQRLEHPAATEQPAPPAP